MSPSSSSICLILAILIAQCCELVSGIVGGEQASPPQPDAAVVFVQKFDRNARIEGMKNDALGYYTFLGLRYAEAPTGARRFQRSTLARLEGETPATRACSPCAQPHPSRPDQLLGSEDCLCLNIYSPKMPGSEKGSPVLFWIHGGGFRQGSASYYGGDYLAQKDTILVSVQYRLGSLGFLSNDNRDVSGNLGLLDMSTALQWVLDYIEFFGGDPTRVVTIGQGSGGTAASLLSLSPLSRGGVRGVAALSGAPLAPAAVDRQPRERAQSLANHTRCPPEPASALVSCLRSRPLEQIVKADSKIKEGLIEQEGFISDTSGKTGTGVSVEGLEDERALPPLVQLTPADSVARGEQRVPLLTGVVRDETARAVFGKNAKKLSANLLKVPGYINKEVISPLKRQLVDLIPAELQKNIPMSAVKLLSLDTYYSFLSTKTANVTQGLLKIVEATSDAFFNYPAFISADKWSEGASAYLYRFQYKGNKVKGRHFLEGLDIVGSGSPDQQDEFIAHGDELAYLFEPLDVEGKPISTAPGDPADDHVRDLFTNLIVNFAHNVSLTKGEKKSTFTSTRNQFLQIDSDVKVDDNFRFCQMALWGNFQQRLQDATCVVLAALEDQLGGVVSSAGSGKPNLVPNILNQFQQAPKLTKLPWGLK